jgi:hypothetical protein
MMFRICRSVPIVIRLMFFIAMERLVLSNFPSLSPTAVRFLSRIPYNMLRAEQSMRRRRTLYLRLRIWCLCNTFSKAKSALQKLSNKPNTTKCRLSVPAPSCEQVRLLVNEHTLIRRGHSESSETWRTCVLALHQYSRVLIETEWRTWSWWQRDTALNND